MDVSVPMGYAERMTHLLARATALPFGLSRCDKVLSKDQFTAGIPTCEACLEAQHREADVRSAEERPAREREARAALHRPSVTGSAPSIGLRPIGAPAATPVPALPTTPKIGLRPLGAPPVVPPPVPTVAALPPLTAVVAPAAASVEVEAEEMDLDFEALQVHYEVLRRLEAALPDPLPEFVDALDALDATLAQEDKDLLIAVDGALLALGLVRIPHRLQMLRHRGAQEEGADEEDELSAEAEEDAGSGSDPVSDPVEPTVEPSSERAIEPPPSEPPDVPPVDPPSETGGNRGNKAPKRAGRKA